jgi:hypothetical protein
MTAKVNPLLENQGGEPEGSSRSGYVTITATLPSSQLPSSCAIAFEAGQVRVAAIDAVDALLTGIQVGDIVSCIGDQKLPANASREEVRDAFARVRKPFDMVLRRAPRHAQLRSMFDELDSSGNGYIEGSDIVRLANLKGADDEMLLLLREKFKALGPDHMGRVSWEAFRAHSVSMEQEAAPPTPAAAAANDGVFSVTIRDGQSTCAFQLRAGQVVVARASEEEQGAGLRVGLRVICAGGRVVPPVVSAAALAEIFGGLKKPFGLVLKRDGRCADVPPPAVVRDEMQPAQTTARRPSIPGITVAVERLDRDDANDVPAIGKVERHRRGQHCGTPPQRPARWDVDDVADPGADAGAAFISSGGIAGGRNRNRFGSGVVVLPKMPDTTPLTAATAPLTTPPLQGPTQPQPALMTAL